MGLAFCLFLFGWVPLRMPDNAFEMDSGRYGEHRRNRERMRSVILELLPRTGFPRTEEAVDTVERNRNHPSSRALSRTRVPKRKEHQAELVNPPGSSGDQSQILYQLNQAIGCLFRRDPNPHFSRPGTNA